MHSKLKALCVFQRRKLFNLSTKSNKDIIEELEMLVCKMLDELSGYKHECTRILDVAAYLIQRIQNKKIQLLTAIFWNIYKNKGINIRESRFLLMHNCKVFNPVLTAAYKSQQSITTLGFLINCLLPLKVLQRVFACCG